VNIVFDPLAEKELDEAFLWYEEQLEGLGKQFITVIQQTILRLSRYPELYPECIPGIRRALVKKFPYGVFYSIDKDTVVIYAIAHLHRLPFYWATRKKSS